MDLYCFPSPSLSSLLVILSTVARCSSGKRANNTRPTRDCNAATRKFPRGSEEARSESRISCTPALQRLHFPSKRTIGRESEGLNMEGMSNNGCCLAWEVDRLRERPKRML